MRKREFSFMYNPQYQGIIKNIQKGLKQVINLVEYDSKEERIQETKSQIINNTRKQLDEFVLGEKKRISDEKKSIEKSFASSKNVYENPIEELLRRQDFDMEVAAMDENEINALLKTPGRNFSDYELNKIYSLDIRNSDIKATVKRAINENRQLFLKDVKYQKLMNEENELSLIENKPLQDALFYLPSSNSHGYTTLGISNVFLNLDKNDLSKKLAILDESLTVKPSENLKTFSSGLQEKINEESLTEKVKMNYEDFDARIFRGANEFDIADRFKYLEERFDDKATDRFDKSKEDYNVMAHLDFLEGQHAKKMSSDGDYFEAYSSAEKKALRTVESSEQNQEGLINEK